MCGGESSRSPTVILTHRLVGDAPAPVPAFDPRYDYFTGNPDQLAAGGAASTVAGYGPNTRTIMQFRVGTGIPEPFDPAPLNAALPLAYVASQPPPIVPQTAYPAPWKAGRNTYARIQSNSLTFTDEPLAKVMGIRGSTGPRMPNERFESTKP